MTTRTATGYDWWTFGAQKGAHQPPYVVKLRGRWWRTLPFSAPIGEASLRVCPDELERLRALPKLPFGARRCMDHLNRTGKSFRDLPVLRLADGVSEDGK